MQTLQEQRNSLPNDAEAALEKEFTPPAKKPVYDFCKRIFDIVMSAFALIVLSPVFLVVAIAIRREDGGKAIYSQVRLTKGGKEFKMYKFRSMCVDAEKQLDSLMDRNEMTGPAFKIADDPRITKIGRFIRKTSIDELPQLLNILKGDMSIIGPRPPLPREVAQYTPYQMHRLDVKTGLACYHECQGRSDSHDFDEWVESDLKYIRERSMLTDLKVIWWTAKVVLTGKGAM
ncbi:MAG: sugar transferase [Oscillospiraceae bacterium]|nr:sugar transferase [Oscillospiraceae bacterium]